MLPLAYSQTLNGWVSVVAHVIHLASYSSMWTIFGKQNW